MFFLMLVRYYVGLEKRGIGMNYVCIFVELIIIFLNWLNFFLINIVKFVVIGYNGSLR